MTGRREPELTVAGLILALSKCKDDTLPVVYYDPSQKKFPSFIGITGVNTLDAITICREAPCDGVNETPACAILATNRFLPAGE